MTFRATPRLSLEAFGLYYRGTVHDVELGDLPFSVDDLSADVVGVGMGVAWRIR